MTRFQVVLFQRWVRLPLAFALELETFDLPGVWFFKSPEAECPQWLEYNTPWPLSSNIERRELNPFVSSHQELFTSLSCWPSSDTNELRRHSAQWDAFPQKFRGSKSKTPARIRKGKETRSENSWSFPITVGILQVHIELVINQERWVGGV